MAYHKWLIDLQLFAGEGEGGGEGAASGEKSAVDAGQQKLQELGVPAEKLRKRANRPEKKLPDAAAHTAQGKRTAAQDAAAEKTEGPETGAPPRLSWEEIMADPEYNREMQAVVRARLNAERARSEKSGDRATAAGDSPEPAADRATAAGDSPEPAADRDTRERGEAEARERQRFAAHIRMLEQQGGAMKAAFPGFDLRRELQNPVFARMTSPNVGISVEDAYYAVHRREIQTAAMQVTAQKTAQKISNAIQAGQRRPAENGTSGQAASVTTFDYSKASRAQREALKQRIRAAAARGEKLYP